MPSSGSAKTGHHCHLSRGGRVPRGHARGPSSGVPGGAPGCSQRAGGHVVQQSGLLTTVPLVHAPRVRKALLGRQLERPRGAGVESGTHAPWGAQQQPCPRPLDAGILSVVMSCGGIFMIHGFPTAFLTICSWTAGTVSRSSSYSQCLSTFLARRRHSIDVCWVNPWMFLLYLLIHLHGVLPWC